MTPDQAENAIKSAFNTAWASATPIAWDNVDFDAEAQTSAWVRVSVQFILGTIASLGAPGARNFRNFGIVFVQVFSPVGGGKSANTVLATQARNVFRGVQLAGGLWFRNASIAHVGPEGRWYQQNVSAEFVFDETET